MRTFSISILSPAEFGKMESRANIKKIAILNSEEPFSFLKDTNTSHLYFNDNLNISYKELSETLINIDDKV